MGINDKNMTEKKIFNTKIGEFTYPGDKKRYLYRKMNGRFSKDSSLDEFIHLLQNWENILGKMGKVTLPLKVTKETLYIISDHPSYSLEIKKNEKSILSKIQRNYPFIGRHLKYTKIQTSKVPILRRQPQEENSQSTMEQDKFHRFSPQYKALKNKAKNLSESIDDEELKEIFENMVIKNS